jgi:hypothetical protein
VIDTALFRTVCIRQYRYRHRRRRTRPYR